MNAYNNITWESDRLEYEEGSTPYSNTLLAILGIPSDPKKGASLYRPYRAPFARVSPQVSDIQYTDPSMIHLLKWQSWLTQISSQLKLSRSSSKKSSIMAR